MKNHQGSFLQIAHQKKLKCEKFLGTMEQVIPWKEYESLIKSYYYQKKDKEKGGRPQKELREMIKIHFLQQWYNLSDPGVEEAIYDRNSFQKFLGIDLLADKVPDETTILNFRRLLERHNLQGKMFDKTRELLEEGGYLMKRGTLTDATIVVAPSSTKNKLKKRDSEMSSTKKGNNYYFGMKTHIGVDVESGLVSEIKGSTAKESDISYQKELLHGEEKLIGGDKGYWSDKQKRECRRQGIYFAILDKSKRNRKLSSSQKKKNKKLNRLKAKVEHPFLIVKHLWKHAKTRYRGIEKNTKQWTTLMMLANIYKLRRKMLAVQAI